MARLEHRPSRCSNFLLLGRRHWRICASLHILGVVTKGKSPGMGREAQGTQLLTAHSSSLPREHVMKLGNIHLCVVEPSNS